MTHFGWRHILSNPIQFGWYTKNVVTHKNNETIPNLWPNSIICFLLNISGNRPSFCVFDVARCSRLRSELKSLGYIDIRILPIPRRSHLKRYIYQEGIEKMRAISAIWMWWIMRCPWSHSIKALQKLIYKTEFPLPSKTLGLNIKIIFYNYIQWR